MIKWIITASLVGLTALFGFLTFAWGGFQYFAFAFAILLSLFWIGILIKNFYEDYYQYFDDDFKEFKAKKINSTLITEEIFEQNRALYIKEYKKSLTQSKVIDIFKILFILAIVVACAVAIF